MGREVEAAVFQEILPTHNRKRTKRRFYRLDIPGVIGHPAYEDWEISRVG
jgi:hypothetical protein